MGCGSSTDAAATNKTAGDAVNNGKLGKGLSQTAPAKLGAHKGGDGARTLKLSNAILDKAGDVRDYYTFDKVLGKGNFGVVHLVFDKKTNAPYACKSISKRKLTTPDDIEDVKREIEILLHLGGHKNIVQMYGAYEDKSYIHVVMEVCAGGELFDRIAEKGHYSEKAAAEVMRTIVGVVNHCHTMNVIHRDLKPENFLLSSKKSDAILKATDFGLSRFFVEGKMLDEIVGSPFYVAPEVLKRKYGKEADIWSCGVILYILLCGYPPFHGDSTQQIFKHIISQPLDLKSDPWPRIGEGAKDCVKRMLARDPRKRLTASDLLHHPWMKVNGVASDESLQPEVLSRLRTFGNMNKLKKEALKIIARSLPTNEIKGIREMFKAIDTDGSGCITVDELREGLKKKGAELAFSEVENIVGSIDVNGNHLIDYEEFLAATMHLSKLNKEEVMVEAFKHFDLDSSGFITREELLTALSEVGGIEIEDVEAIIEAADLNKDGSIDYEEFCVMMRNNDFEGLVQAKSALRSKMALKPAGGIMPSDMMMPEDLVPDDEKYGIQNSIKGGKPPQ
jgi:calcium-dependent protein kinase